MTAFNTAKARLKDDPYYGCMDCHKVCDMYMVKDSIWNKAVPEQPEIEQENRLKLRAWRDNFKTLDQRRHPTREEVTHFKRKHCRSCVLCFNCLEKRLGRNLGLDDFTDASINRPILLGYAIRMQESGLCE